MRGVWRPWKARGESQREPLWTVTITETCNKPAREMTCDGRHSPSVRKELGKNSDWGEHVPRTTDIGVQGSSCEHYKSRSHKV